MFVRAKTHEELRKKYEKLVMDNDRLQRDWNRLVRLINSKGGQKFLDGETTPQFSDSEIRIMIKLCHPDKHGNSADATLMTQTLLGLRKK